VLGLTGAGGSVFAVPLLIIFLGFEPDIAMGLALGAVAVSAAYGSFLQRQNIIWLPSVIFVFGGVFVAPFGKWLATFISGEYLLSGFALIALVISVKMYLDAQRNPESTFHTRVAPEGHDSQDAYICRFSAEVFELKPKCASYLVLGGVITGFASGLFGVGGGFLVVPILLFLGQLPMRKAVASSLLIIFFVSGSGFIGFALIDGLQNTNTLLMLLAGSMVGIFFSRQVAEKISGPKLQKLFAIALICITFASFANYLYT